MSALPLESGPRPRRAAPQPVMRADLPIFDYHTFYAPARTEGFVYISDGEDGHWVTGWAYEEQKGYEGERAWTERGYRPTHFAPAPAAPIDGVTV